MKRRKFLSQAIVAAVMPIATKYLPIIKVNDHKEYHLVGVDQAKKSLDGYATFRAEYDEKNSVHCRARKDVCLELFEKEVERGEARLVYFDPGDGTSGRLVQTIVSR